MLDVAEAEHCIQSHLPVLGTERVSLTSVAAATLATAIASDRALPPYDRVMMDGIAVQRASVDHGQRSFAIAAVAAAGEPQKTLTDPATCIEVMTGAVLPQGCDWVIPYEALTLEAGYATLITDLAAAAYIHSQGSDTSTGDVLVAAGSRLNGPRWGIAASVGAQSVLCLRQPRVLLIATGGELVPVAATPLAHQIRQSNVHALQASLRREGFAVVDTMHVADDRAQLETLYTQSRDRYDWLIYSGGVSRGKFDYVPTLLQSLGVTEIFHRVAQRPGKPLWFGVDTATKTAVFGLPGNPISSLVCLHRYCLSNPPIYAQLSQDFQFDLDLAYFLPVKLHYTPQAQIVADPLRFRNSGEFTALAESDGFIELPRTQSHFAAGECFRYFAWR